ncbi:CRISPR-associated helicase Cas3' [Paenibacillus ferrarius]|uniref:CRISPR-associated helicase Cas3' n=1 Tax=Paenibacillus ferrarius TaxID=1469647 RepID=UPI003D266A96
MNSIAHIRESDHHIQTVEEHLTEVQALAEQFGDKIGVKHIAGLAGLLHDMGKYTDKFTTYIYNAVFHPEKASARGSVDHSTAGGKLLYELFHTTKPAMYTALLAEIVGNAIISHHAYLHDFLNYQQESPYLRRVAENSPDEYNQAKKTFYERVATEQELRQYAIRAAEELEAYLAKASGQTKETKLMFLSKFIFSTLIDADRTNTRLFEENRKPEPPLDRQALFSAYYEKLLLHLQKLQAQTDANSPVNLLRKAMSDRCDEWAVKPSGIYTLSIPTGGGKTLASFRYALKHAIQTGKRRIIYIVPFTTIIEQNAKEICSIVGDDAYILEHHSNVIEDDDDDKDEQEDGLITPRQKLKLAKDNWDAPVIFTTMVQFLNAFFAKGSRNIRRLHNLSEAVVIFDEVQKVPISCISLFNQALNFLHHHGRSSLILCTATQPSLQFVKRKLDVGHNAEMIENLPKVIQAFKRVNILCKAAQEGMNTTQLANFAQAQLLEGKSVLVILNTKTVVKKLYQRLAHSDSPLYHLSTSMCPAHRNAKLDEIRKRLSDGEKLICLSTQLIEAGVDISFDCVIRSLAGLDSIAQAAGRCNRHGKNGIQEVYLIDHEEENLKHLREIRVGKEITKQLLVDLQKNPAEHGGDLLSADAMMAYFRKFYKKLEAELDYPLPDLLHSDMMNLLTADRRNSVFHETYVANKKKNLPLYLPNSYRTAAEHFEVISSRTTAVLVPYDDEGKELITQLNGAVTIEGLSRLLRKAQQYTINLFRYEMQLLDKHGGLVSLLDGKVMALKESAYNEEFGLDVANDSGFDFGFI